jgi:hypothetical protein
MRSLRMTYELLTLKCGLTRMLGRTPPHCTHKNKIKKTYVSRKHTHCPLDIVLAGGDCAAAELHTKLGGRIVHAPGCSSSKLALHHGGYTRLSMTMGLLWWRLLLLVLERGGIRGDVCRRVAIILVGLAGLRGGGETLVSLGRAWGGWRFRDISWMSRYGMSQGRRGGHFVTLSHSRDTWMSCQLDLI